MQKEYIIISCIGVGFMIINTKYRNKLGYNLLAVYSLFENKIMNTTNKLNSYFRNYFYSNRKKTISLDGFKANEFFKDNIIYYKINENESELITPNYFISCFIKMNNKDYELKLDDRNMNFFVSGNKILDYNFVKWLFGIKYDISKFDDDYKITILDNNVNEIELTKLNYIILDNSRYYLKEKISYDMKGNVINSCNIVRDAKNNSLDLLKLNTNIEESNTDTEITSDDEQEETDEGGVIII